MNLIWKLREDFQGENNDIMLHKAQNEVGDVGLTNLLTIERKLERVPSLNI